MELAFPKGFSVGDGRELLDRVRGISAGPEGGAAGDVSAAVKTQDIIVRPETGGDVKAIDVVNLSAFEGEKEAQLVTLMRQLPGFVPALSLVAELHGRIVGHVLLTKVPLQKDGGRASKALALGPMSVVPSQSHRGIGSVLIKAAVEQARGLGFDAIVVVGHPEYYRRLGFEPAQKWGLSCNLRVPEDAVMALELQAGTLQDGGRAVYPDPFSKIF